MNLIPVEGKPEPAIDASHPDAVDIQGGFEGGRVVKEGVVYHMFPTERRGAPGVDAYYDRIKTTVGHWTSPDCIHWRRQGTILEGSGHYTQTGEDVEGNDRRASLWAAMPVFNNPEGRWDLFYVAYTANKEIGPNHLHGRIWRATSEVPGRHGITGPYRDVEVILAPNGPDAQPWEGRQGIDSFFPFSVDNGWLAFYGSACNENYGKDCRWEVGLAEAESLSGPWKRRCENPIRIIHDRFVENPIVHRFDAGGYVFVMDGGPASLGLANRIGYSFSEDGYNWTPAQYIEIETVIPKTWAVMRTPLGLVPEEDGTFSMIFNARVAGERFAPAWYVRLAIKS